MGEDAVVAVVLVPQYCIDLLPVLQPFSEHSMQRLLPRLEL